MCVCCNAINYIIVFLMIYFYYILLSLFFLFSYIYGCTILIAFYSLIICDVLYISTYVSISVAVLDSVYSQGGPITCIVRTTSHYRLHFLHLSTLKLISKYAWFSNTNTYTSTIP